MNEQGRRRRVVLVGAGAALGLLVVGIMLLRLSRPAGVDAEPETAAVNGATDNPGSSQTAGATSTGERADTAGVARSEAGAVAAAVSYAGASQRWLYSTDEQIAAAVAEIATPDSVDQLTDEILADIGSARDDLAESPGRIWWLVHPLAWRVDRYDADEATVDVWLMTLLSASDVAVPQTEWLTATLELEWADGAWRLDAVRETPGPTPMIGPRDDPWEPEPFDDALSGFTRLGGEPEVPAGGP